MLEKHKKKERKKERIKKERKKKKKSKNFICLTSLYHVYQHHFLSLNLLSSFLSFLL
jgi:hypothetical protein